METQETYLPHPAYAGYLVGTHGTILSTISDPKGKRRKTHVNRIGYECIIIRLSPGKYLTEKVHRLVAQTHIPNPDSLPEVNHIDHNKTNNRAGNLEWTTHRENIRKARAHHGTAWQGYKGKRVIATPLDGTPPQEWQSVRHWATTTGNRNPNRAANVCTAIKTGRPAYGYTWREV